MIFESPFIWFIGTIVMFVVFILMRLKKKTISQCLATEITLACIIYFIAATMFPLNFVPSINSFSLKTCHSFLPLANVLNARLTIINSQGETSYYYEYVYRFMKLFILDIGVSVIVSAAIYFNKRKKSTACILSIVSICIVIMLKIALIYLNISTYSFYDTVEFIVVSLGCLAGVSSMKHIIEYNLREEKDE